MEHEHKYCNWSLKRCRGGHLGLGEGEEETEEATRLKKLKTTDDGLAAAAAAADAKAGVTVPFPNLYVRNLFDSNYPTWVKHMKLYLKKLNVEYVLHEPCPGCPNINNIPPAVAAALTDDEQNEYIALSKAAQQKWLKDDSICHRTILRHLSKHLAHCFGSNTPTTTTTTNEAEAEAEAKAKAKPLWDALWLEMRLTLGRPSFLVKKYQEFRMLNEGDSIVDQVEQLNDLFDLLVAARVPITEEFHALNIINMLPPSWKDVRADLLAPLHRTLPMVMDRLNAEEDAEILTLRMVTQSLRIQLQQEEDQAAY